MLKIKKKPKHPYSALPLPLLFINGTRFWIKKSQTAKVAWDFNVLIVSIVYLKLIL